MLETRLKSSLCCNLLLGHLVLNLVLTETLALMVYSKWHALRKYLAKDLRLLFFVFSFQLIKKNSFTFAIFMKTKLILME
jgi:hypothetical protein